MVRAVEGGEDRVSALTERLDEAAVAPARPALVSTGKGPVEYAEYGDGPAVLALHGAMGGWDQGLLLARTVAAARHRFIGISRPGYLGTPLSAGRSPEEQADLYAAVLDALGVRDAAVMAVSGGGPSALHFALRHRERCRALVLVSTCGGRVTTRLPLAFQVLRLAARWPWLAERMERKAASQDPDAAARRSIPDAAVRERTLADRGAGPLFRELLASTSDRMALRLPGTLNDVAVTRARSYPLDRIAVPVLVVHGTKDAHVPFPEHGELLAARIPGAELVALEGGEHVAIFTHRDEARARVVRFLAAHAG
jgi:pimeloyl-ACP methyl ester carboxylesterase